MTWRWLLSCVLLCGGINHAFANELENTRFQHLSTNQGLSQKTVQTIYQDATGFMWFGTQEGLNRYDGHAMRVFRHNSNDPFSLSHDAIRDIHEDADGQLYVATSGGLNRFNAANERFETLDIKLNGESVLRFNTLYRDRSGVLWVGTDGNGLLRMVSSEATPQFEPFAVSEALLNADVRVIFEDSRGRLWIGTDGQGVFRFANQTLQAFQTNDGQSGLSHDRIRDIIEDSKGRIWVGTRGGGLNRFDELNKTFIAYRQNQSPDNAIAHDRVYQIIEDDFARLWIATDGGISVFNLSTETFSTIAHKSSQKSALTHNRVLSAFKDQGGLLWFGTLSGLNRWNPKYATFVHYRNISEDQFSLSNNTVYSLAQLSQQKVAVGTFGGGVNILDIATGRVNVLTAPSAKATRIMSMLVDSQQRLWVGSIASGLELFDQSLQLVASFQNDPEKPSSLSADGVTDILEDSNGTIWVATYRAGLNKFNPTLAQFERFNMRENTSGLQSESIFAITEDDDGYIWLATDGGGLSRLDKTSGEIITLSYQADNEHSLSGNIASAIYFDSRGRLWVGTHGNGLNLWMPNDRRQMNNHFTHFSVSEGLNSSTINGIIEDQYGDIWISTVKGVSKLNFQTMTFENFNLADEIHFNELNQGALLATEDGQLFFGGLNGVSAFRPDKLSKNQHIPNVVLTGIYNENESLTYTEPVYQLDAITLTHQDYLIAFEFAALDFSNPSKNQYQYKLEGFDENWISTGQRSRTTFTNLPTGEYVFKVKGSNDDGLWSEESILLTIVVLPAPWATWWAFSIYALIFCVVLIGFIRVQAKRLALNDVFQDQVDSAVTNKTEIIRRHSAMLEESFKKLSEQSMVNVDDGLPNHRFFIEQLDLVVELTRGSDQYLERRRSLAIIMVNTGSASINEIEMAMQNALDDNGSILSFARWSQNEVVMLVCASDKTLLINQVKTFYEQHLQPKNMSLAMLMPYQTLLNAVEASDLIMLIVEFISGCCQQKQTQKIIIVGDVLQMLDAALVRDLLRQGNIEQLTETFDIC